MHRFCFLAMKTASILPLVFLALPALAGSDRSPNDLTLLATFFAGKWHLGNKGSWPEDHGFEIDRAAWPRWIDHTILITMGMEGRRPRCPPRGHDATRAFGRVPCALTSSHHSRSSGTMTLH